LRLAPIRKSSGREGTGRPLEEEQKIAAPFTKRRTESRAGDRELSTGRTAARPCHRDETGKRATSRRASRSQSRALDRETRVSVCRKAAGPRDRPVGASASVLACTRQVAAGRMQSILRLKTYLLPRSLDSDHRGPPPFEIAFLGIESGSGSGPIGIRIIVRNDPNFNARPRSLQTAAHVLGGVGNTKRAVRESANPRIGEEEKEGIPCSEAMHTRAACVLSAHQRNGKINKRVWGYARHPLESSRHAREQNARRSERRRNIVIPRHTAHGHHGALVPFLSSGGNLTEPNDGAKRPQNRRRGATRERQKGEERDGQTERKEKTSRWERKVARSCT